MKLGVYIGCGVKRLAWYGPKPRHANSQPWDAEDARTLPMQSGITPSYSLNALCATANSRNLAPYV